MHYYKRNLGDYAKKAGRLSMLQHGAYTLLIDACYDREQFPTMAEAIDWTWASSSVEVEAVEFVLSKFFALEDGRYVQSRIKEEIDDYRAKSATNARIAKDRETKRAEKRTDRVRVVDVATRVDNEAPPNQEPITINQTPSVEGVAPRKRVATPPQPDIAKPDDVEPQTWADFLKLRKAKRAPVTQTVVDEAKRECAKAGMTLENFLRVWCRRGSQGLEAAWLKPEERQSARFGEISSDTPAETYAQRAARQRMEEAAPMAARKAPGAAFDAAQRFMRGDVVDVTPAPQQLQVM